MTDVLILSDDVNFIDKVKKQLPISNVYVFNKRDKVREPLDCIINYTPDYLLLDIEYERVSWPVLVKSLNSTGITIDIIIADNTFDIFTRKECMLYGVKGYILKSDVEKVIIESISNIKKGFGYYQIK